MYEMALCCLASTPCLVDFHTVPMLTTMKSTAITVTLSCLHHNKQIVIESFSKSVQFFDLIRVGVYS